MVSLRDQTILALRQQVAEVAKERDEALSHLAKLVVVAERLDAEVGALRALLREAQEVIARHVADGSYYGDDDFLTHLAAVLEGRDDPR